MVATVVELRSSALAVSYYEKDGYYAKDSPEHRNASFWAGAAARALGLRAHVLPREFEDVLAGWVPGTELRLGRMREGEHDHRPGWDITFSAPKSVSLEALVTGDRRVIRAHDDAVRATLAWLESELLETRGWDPATRRRPRVGADGMVVAGFRHLISRDQDPQLHTHCVLANMTRNADGAWRSVEPTRIRRSVKLIGAYYRNELARRLQALGMAVTPTLVGRVPGFELAGYERSFLDAFSGRRREILAHLERLGLPYTPALAQMAALHTRRRKREVGLAELVPAWRDRARALGLKRDKAALRPARPLDPDTGKPVPPPEVPLPDLPAKELRSLRRAPKLPPLPPNPRPDHAPAAGAAGALSAEPETGVLEAVARAVAHAAERRTTIPEAEIRAVALGHAPGRYGLGEIDAVIARLVRGGELIEVERRGMDRAFVTDRAVKAERHVLAAMRAGRGTGEALADAETVEERLAGTRLTAGQKAAVRTLLLSDDVVVGVQGHAGSGKTTMLCEVAGLLGGTTIQGLAPSAAAARVLEREAGIPSRTLQYFLTRFGGEVDPRALAQAREAYAGSVLAVDEASMIDTVRMRDLLAIAADLGVARVALVGDTAQLRAVDAGQPFRLLQKAGMTTATMDEVLRQRDPELLAAVGLARVGEAGAAIAGLGARVREAPREELGGEAARRWLGLAPGERDDTLLLAPTHAIRRQANEVVREGLAREGCLHGRTLAVDRLVDRRLTRAQAADIASYKPGDTVVFHRDHYGCRRDDVCTVTAIEEGVVVLAHADGGERRFRPSGNAAWYLRLCDTEPIELRAGERIRWTRNRKAPRARFGHPQAPDLVNGGEAEIVGIDWERVRFRDADGTAFGLALADPQLRHLDHAYCSTVHAAQGRTAAAAIAVLDAHAGADRELFHVELSRVRDSFLLLTDDREALVERLESHAGGGDGALEALGIDPAAIPAVEADVLADLADDWRTLQRRAEETGTVPFFVPGYREVMARAAALSAIEDLPPDMRRFVETMLAEHEGHLARDRTVRELIGKVRETWRQWPELGWAATARGCDMEELPRYAAWRKEGTALLAEGRRRLAGEGDAARHLRAMPGGHDGLAAAVATLERTRALDDARRLGPVLQALQDEVTALLDERTDLEACARDLHRSGFAPPTELGEYAAWSARCDAAVRRWPAMRRGLDPSDDRTVRLAADVGRLRRLRVHDEAWAEWYAMRGKVVAAVRRDKAIPFHVEGWDAFVNETRSLARRRDLPAAAAEAARAVLKYHRKRLAEWIAVEGFLRSARAYGDFWDGLQEDRTRRARVEPDVSTVDLPDYRPLTKPERGLGETGRTILEGGRTYGPHLRRIPDAARDVRATLERLAKHDLLDRSVAVRTRLRDAERAAHACCVMPFDDGDCAAALDEVRRLAEERELEEAARRRLQADIDAYEARQALWREIVRLLEEVARLSLVDCDLDERAERKRVPRNELQGWQDWYDASERLLADVHALLDQDAARQVLQSRPDIFERLREALASLGEWLQPDIGPAPGAPGEETLGAERPGAEGPWPEPDDWPIVCKRNIVEHDILRWGAFVEPAVSAETLPSGMDPEHRAPGRYVRFEGEFLERRAGRTEKEDLCTVDVSWRSDGAACGRLRCPLGVLMGGGCSRVEWSDEEERSQKVEAHKWQLDLQRAILLKQELERKLEPGLYLSIRL